MTVENKTIAPLYPDMARIVAEAVAKQSWYIRRKDTILAILAGVVWVAQAVATEFTGLPEGVGVGLGVAGTVAATLLHALTKGAITPSAAARLQVVADKQAARVVDMAHDLHDVEPVAADPGEVQPEDLEAEVEHYNTARA